MKAFGTDYMGADGIVMAETASKARYAFYLSVKDAGYKPDLTKIRVWRLRDFDGGTLTWGGQAEPNKPYCAEYVMRTSC